MKTITIKQSILELFMTQSAKQPARFHSLRFVLLLVCVLWVVAACNLSTDEAPPPTLMPRVTDQVLPTLGFSTPIPGQGDGQVQIGPAPTNEPVGARLYNLLNQVNGDRLINHVGILQGFQSRHVNSRLDSDTEGIGAAYRYILAEFQKIAEASPGNFAVLVQPTDVSVGGQVTRQHNIIGYTNGTVPGAGVIVVGAHYDSTDTTNQANAHLFAPGADDNGTGVAAIIEMARILSTEPLQARVVFVLFSAEEYDRQGSRSFIRDYVQVTNIPVAMMINLDTIGSNNDRHGNVNDTQIRLFADPDKPDSVHFARMLDFIADNHTTDLDIVVQQAIDRTGRFGDHFSFNEVGIPAVRFIESLEDTDHREGTDTVDYVDQDYFRRATRTILTTIVAISDGLRPPGELVLRDMGSGLSRLVWAPVEGATGYLVAARLPGEVMYEHFFPAPGTYTAYDCECFTRYEGMAVAAVNADGIMGPLSIEYRVP